MWHSPGNNLIGGDHLGTEQAIVFIREQKRLSNDTLHVEARDLRPNAVVLHATAQREGHGTLDQDEEIRFSIEDGKVSELWTVPRDVTAWDRFFAP